MLLEIANHLVGDLSFLNVFRYITFRTGGAMLTALVVSFIFGDWICFAYSLGDIFTRGGVGGVINGMAFSNRFGVD